MCLEPSPSLFVPRCTSGSGVASAAERVLCSKCPSSLFLFEGTLHSQRESMQEAVRIKVTHTNQCPATCLGASFLIPLLISKSRGLAIFFHPIFQCPANFNHVVNWSLVAWLLFFPFFLSSLFLISIPLCCRQRQKGQSELLILPERNAMWYLWKSLYL